MIQKHVIYCTHPNFQNAGQLDDWVIIQDPNDGVDIHFGKEPATSSHVPARIVALVFQDPDTNETLAIICACHPWMEMNYDRSIVITESWHLQHQV
jgi:hypothetical protein